MYIIFYIHWLNFSNRREKIYLFHGILFFYHASILWLADVNKLIKNSPPLSVNNEHKEYNIKQPRLPAVYLLRGAIDLVNGA